MNKTLAGAIAGAVATVPMSWAMEVMHRALPTHERQPLPPREIVERMIEISGTHRQIPGDSRPWLTLVAHLGYGAAVGSIFAAASRGGPSKTLSRGILYGLAVWAASYFGLLPALNILSPAHRHPVRRNALMVVAHIVFGSALEIFTDLICDGSHGEGLHFLGGQSGPQVHQQEVAT